MGINLKQKETTKDLVLINKFLDSKYIDVVPVKIVSHPTLNQSQEEMVKDLEEFDVTGGKTFMIKEGDQFVATGGAVITFNLIRLQIF